MVRVVRYIGWKQIVCDRKQTTKVSAIREKTRSQIDATAKACRAREHGENARNDDRSLSATVITIFLFERKLFDDTKQLINDGKYIEIFVVNACILVRIDVTWKGINVDGTLI